MPAAVVKGILLSVSIITALGLAVLENPQVQSWLEQQRQKLLELLRSVGDELDPESRRQAEVVVLQGRTAPTPAEEDHELSESNEVASMATGLSLANAGIMRRIPVQGSTSPDEAEERRRKGREYLAKRNQEMLDRQEKRKAAKRDGAVATTPPSPSFDAMVNIDGHLKPPSVEPLATSVQYKVQEIERNLTQPIPIPASGTSAFQLGSQVADPFGDEFAMDRSLTPRPFQRSETPKPPVPPKVRFDTAPQEIPPVVVTGDQPSELPRADNDLTYEEQLAIALSLSAAESSATAVSARQRADRDEDGLSAAIAASLKDMDDQHTVPRITIPQTMVEDSQPLVDLRSSNILAPIATRSSRGDWEKLFNTNSTPIHGQSTQVPPPASTFSDSDELYRLTPELTRARLATHDAQLRISSAPSSPPSLQPHDLPSRSLHQLVDVSDTPALSESGPVHRHDEHPQPPPRSETSTIEVLDVIEDSDADLLSDDEGDGIFTPDSWTEVGSRDGESDEDDVVRRRNVTA